MAVRVRIPGDHFIGKSVQILEHVLQFAEDGWAEAGHLTDKEIQRCVQFGYKVEHIIEGKGKAAKPEPQPEQPAGSAPEAEAPPADGEPPAAQADPPVDASQDAQARLPVTKRTP